MADLRARTSLDPSGMKTGFGQMKDEAKSFQGQLEGVGRALTAAVSVGAITAFVSSTVQAGSTISDMAAQIGIGVEELQALQAEANRTGVSNEALQRGLRHVKQRVQEAAGGAQSYANALEDLGLSTERLLGMPLEKQLEAIATAYTNASNESEAWVAVQRIIGEEAGPMMMEMLNSLAHDGFDVVAQSARDAGMVMSQETIGSLDKMADRWERFQTQKKALGGWLIHTYETSLKGLDIWANDPDVGLNPFKAYAKALGDTDSTQKPPAGPSLENLAEEEREKKNQEQAEKRALDNLRRVQEQFRLSKMDRQQQIAFYEKRVAMAEEEYKLAKDDMTLRAQVYTQQLQDEMKLAELKKQQRREDEQAADREAKEDDKVFDARQEIFNAHLGKGVSMSAIVADRFSRIGGQIGGQVSEKAYESQRAMQVADNIARLVERLPPEIARHLAPELGFVP